MERRPSRSRVLIALAATLVALTWAVFAQTIGFAFVEYDDQNYVYQNHRITEGITVKGVTTAFTAPHADNWHPVTTLSHMLDCSLWGLNPAGHHLVNVLLHVTAVVLLFFLLHGMTGAVWRALFVAALFAIHPLRAESVAWVSERKDVLSGVFFMLTIGAYIRYVRQRCVTRYVAVALLFALGLMSKPTLVTMPILLLLLDFWPLRRDPSISTPVEPFRLILEKVPLLMLSAGSAVATLVAQRQTVNYAEGLPLVGRVGNALISYVTYIGQLFCPTRLAVFYPDTADSLTWFRVISAATVLSAATVAAVRLRKKHPYVMVGWLWYLISLLPVIGIIQVGLQGRADRYTYLPHIGLCIAITWLLGELPIFSVRFRRCSFAAGALAVVALLSWRAAAQTASWKDTESLWSRAVTATKNNDVAENNVAGLLLRRGSVDEAILHYKAALRAGGGSEAPNHLSPAIIENNLGNTLVRKGDIDDAVSHYRNALGIRPSFADARSNLAAMLFRKGDLTGAIAEYEKVVGSPPEDSNSHQKLAEMLVKAHRYGEAIVHFRRALKLSPDCVETINSLAWALATSPDSAIRNSTEALKLAQHANNLTGSKNPFVLRTLAAALAAAGRPVEATATAKCALELASNNQDLANALLDDLRIYGGT